MADRPGFCHCRCHVGARPASVAAPLQEEGVSLADPVEAATACSQCQPKHAVALLNRSPANAPLPPDPTKWFDPPRLHGEGDE